MEGWEEPLHSGSLLRSYPTLSHLATQFACFVPPGTTTLVHPAQNMPLSRGFAVGETTPSQRRAAAARLQKLQTGTILQRRQDSAGRCAWPWGAVGTGSGLPRWRRAAWPAARASPAGERPTPHRCEVAAPRRWPVWLSPTELLSVSPLGAPPAEGDQLEPGTASRRMPVLRHVRACRRRCACLWRAPAGARRAAAAARWSSAMCSCAAAMWRWWLISLRRPSPRPGYMRR